MATLAVNRPTPAGLTLTGGTPAGGGDVFANDGNTILFAHNGSGSPITITFATPGAANGLAVNDLAVSVPAAGVYVIGPFPLEFFNDSSGNVSMTYSGTTSLTVWPIAV